MLAEIFVLFVTLADVFSQEDTCQFSDKLPGRCVAIEQCTQAIAEVKKNVQPKLCGFQSKTPIVCCPSISSRSSKARAKAKQKCHEIMKIQHQRYIGYVVGGVKAKAKDYNHMAALGFGPDDDIQWNCGGSLISSKHVLTAAHCMTSTEFGPVTYARLGDLDLNDSTEDASPQDFSIVKRFVHPDYKPPEKYNDIAILELDRTVKFTDHVKPACLNTAEEVSKPLTATGWGLIDVAGEKSSHLQEVDLIQYPQSECSLDYPPTRKLKRGLDESQLCAGGRGKRKDTCQGDSGGPLQYLNDGARGYTILGITSFGKFCGSTPGVYTRVYTFVPWIESVVWPDD